MMFLQQTAGMFFSIFFYEKPRNLPSSKYIDFSYLFMYTT